MHLSSSHCLWKLSLLRRIPFKSHVESARKCCTGASAGAWAYDTDSRKYFLECLEAKKWLLESPQSKIKRIRLRNPETHFDLIQDDLLHPILGGNKVRKLDALLPKLSSQGITDIVTCGGVQSAHTAAVAAACAERGMRAHLLIRGEKPAVPTGYHLLARMYGHVTHVTRSEYSNRTDMLDKHANIVSKQYPDSKVHILPEGAAEPFSLLGLVRLIQHLAVSGTLDTSAQITFIVDSGTGTTAIGLAIGLSLLRLRWKVVGVMLAGPTSYYRQQEAELALAFGKAFGGSLTSLPLEWKERLSPRKFGKVHPTEIKACAEIAKEHGILLDPIYTLSAWEMASRLAQKDIEGRGEDASQESRIVMLHTGGAAGLHGVAQRFPESF